MKAIWLFPLILMIFAAGARAASDPGIRPAGGSERGDALQRDSFLINDGSFEDGTCQEGASAWTCESSHDCDWIVDLTPLGLWNYDGNHSAWLGGNCQGVPVEYTHICQDILIDGSTLSWFAWRWNYDVGPIAFTVSLDSEVVFEIAPDDWDPQLDYVQEFADVSSHMGELHRLCFNYARNGDDSPPFCFLDYVELSLPTGVPGADEVLTSLSTVKSLY